ncbi:MAG: hypothetical protein ACLPN6_00410 [Streptosporangiaceae bacterium]|nr:hypothetical protein [Actinomycetota bacterium]
MSSAFQCERAGAARAGSRARRGRLVHQAAGGGQVHERVGDAEDLDRRCAARPQLGLVKPVVVAADQLVQVRAELAGLVQGQVADGLARAERVRPAVRPGAAGGQGAAGALQQDRGQEVGQLAGGPRSLRIVEAGRDVDLLVRAPPGPLPAAAAAGLLHVPVAGQRPQVEGAVGRGLAEDLAGLGRGQRPDVGSKHAFRQGPADG